MLLVVSTHIIIHMCDNNSPIHKVMRAQNPKGVNKKWQERKISCFVFLIISLITLLIFCSSTASTLLKSWRSCCITARAPHCMWFWGTPHQCCSSYRGCPSRGLPRTVFERARAAARARDVILQSARMGGNSREFSCGVFTGSQSLGGISQWRQKSGFVRGKSSRFFFFLLLFFLNVWIKLPVDEWQQCGKKNVNLSI